MAWTAKIVSKEFEKGTLRVGILFSNGADAFTESVSVSGKSIDSLITYMEQKAASIEDNEMLVSSVEDHIVQDITVAAKAAMIDPKSLPTP